MMKGYLFFLMASLFFAIPVQAQEEPADTSVLTIQPPDADSTTTDNEYSDEEEDTDEVKDPTDTLLSSAIVYYPADSLRKLRNTKPLNKIENLDSLLKLWQQEILSRSSKRKEQPQTPKVYSLVRLVVWVFVIGSVLFLIFRLFLSEKGMFAAPLRNRNIITEEEDLSDDETLVQKITEAEKSGNYRSAVRYTYLQALNYMASKNWIQLSPDKTNYQYLRELGGKPFRNDFARVTLHYEYAWYGNFSIDRELYETIKKEFKNFQQKIRS